MIIYVYICTCMLDAYITHVPRSHCTYVIHFRVTRMYGTLRIEASKARQGKEVVSSQPACWLSSRIDKPSTDEWINKRKKKKRKRRKEKNDGHASTWPRRIVHHWLRCPIKGQRASNDNNHLNRVCSPIDVSIDKSRIIRPFRIRHWTTLTNSRYVGFDETLRACTTRNIISLSDLSF